MDFEFDEAKSASNEAKHGIDFVGAQALRLDLNRVETLVQVEGEPRWVVVGKIAYRHWSVVITVRGERVRLISARRARPEEVAIYESEGL